MKWAYLRSGVFDLMYVSRLGCGRARCGVTAVYSYEYMNVRCSSILYSSSLRILCVLSGLKRHDLRRSRTRSSTRMHMASLSRGRTDRAKLPTKQSFRDNHERKRGGNSVEATVLPSVSFTHVSREREVDFRITGTPTKSVGRGARLDSSCQRRKRPGWVDKSHSQRTPSAAKEAGLQRVDEVQHTQTGRPISFGAVSRALECAELL